MSNGYYYVYDPETEMYRCRGNMVNYWGNWGDSYGEYGENAAPHSENGVTFLQGKWELEPTIYDRCIAVPMDKNNTPDFINGIPIKDWMDKVVGQ